ncbi:MAG: hypothetical protein ABIG28_03690 [archaeon]
MAYGPTGGPTILSHPIFVETILPFLLIFTIVFAVLQKSKVLGDGKRQIDAIVALVVGLLVISFGQAVGIIVQMIPFLAVSLVILLVFMILVGSFGKSGDDLLSGKMKTFLMIVVLIAVVIFVVWITNFWQVLTDWFFISEGSSLLANVVFVIIVIAAVIAVIVGAGNGGDSSSKSNK